MNLKQAITAYPNLTLHQLGLVIGISRMQGKSQSEIGRELKVGPGEMGYQVDLLSDGVRGRAKGLDLVERRQDVGDARVNRVHLTELGTALIKCVG